MSHMPGMCSSLPSVRQVKPGRGSEFGLAAGAVDQLAAHVQAGVVERLDLVGCGADEEDRGVGDVEDVGVADFGDALFAQRHQPDFGQSFAFSSSWYSRSR